MSCALWQQHNPSCPAISSRWLHEDGRLLTNGFTEDNVPGLKGFERPRLDNFLLVPEADELRAADKRLAGADCLDLRFAEQLYQAPS